MQMEAAGRRSLLPLCLLTSAICIFVAACAARTDVSGTVTWEGKALEQGSITFFPADHKGAAQGAFVINGRYTLTGLTPGRKRVRIVGQPTPVRTGEGGVKLLPPATAIPENAIGNNDVIDIVAGQQTVDFTLTKPPEPAKPPARKKGK